MSPLSAPSSPASRLRSCAVLTFLMLLLLPRSGPAQSLINSDQAPLAIDAELRTAAIEGVLKQLTDRYVFPEVAEKMSQSIKDRLAKKEYDHITSGQDLAKRLTSHLQEVSHDKHIRVSCRTEKLPKRTDQGKPSAKEIERFRAMQKRNNAGFEKVERLPGNVGYIELLGFMDAQAAAEPAAAAMNFLANTDALIIDLRRNGGGSPQTVALICSYFFDETPVHLNSLYWRKGDRTEKFWTRKSVDGKRYLNKDLFILTSNRTFSAAEEFSYNLQCLKRATIVGETTGGGAHPGGGVAVGDHFTIFVPTGRAINPITKTNWEGTGVKPDIAAPADKALDAAHKEAIRRLVANAADEETKRLIQSELDRANAQPKEKKKKAPVIASPALN